MIICTKAHRFFYCRVLGGDGYLFQLHTGHADQNCLVETVLISTTGSYFLLVFNRFHDNLHKVHRFFTLVFLGSDGYLFQLHTGHADQNCLIETVLISITGIFGFSF